MTDQPSESDWKKFREIVPVLRERYLSERNIELISIIRDEALTSTEKFWMASERIDEIRTVLRACLHDHRRSKMMFSLMLMYRHRMISDEDLDGFSEEVRKRIELSRKLT